LVDGGLLSNFPISLLVASDENIDDIMGEGNNSERVIGLLIDETLPVPNSGEPPATPVTTPGLIDRFDFLEETIWRVRGMTDTVLRAHDTAMLGAYEEFVCRLPAQGYGTMEFDMTPERMQAIVAAGEAAMEAYLQAHPAV
jgi:predicted acylesterase/phospholipase RssA